MTGKPTYWIRERVSRLKKFWINDKFTSTEIAERFGCSRNSVIGALDRAGLLGYRRVSGVVASHYKTLEQLDRGDCRYPVNKDHPFLFCGTSTSFEHLPYCDSHMKIAYSPNTSMNYKNMMRKLKRKKKTIDQGTKVG